MQRVYTSSDPVSAGLVLSVLESAGIRCLLRNQYLTGALGELPVNECWPQVWVLDEADAPRARRLIAEALPQQVWVVDHTRRDQRGVRRDMPFHGGGEDRHDPASRRAFSVSRCRM